MIVQRVDIEEDGTTVGVTVTMRARYTRQEWQDRGKAEFSALRDAMCSEAEVGVVIIEGD